MTGHANGAKGQKLSSKLFCLPVNCVGKGKSMLKKLTSLD